jgi:hypothetical protein
MSEIDQFLGIISEGKVRPAIEVKSVRVVCRLRVCGCLPHYLNCGFSEVLMPCLVLEAMEFSFSQVIGGYCRHQFLGFIGGFGG